MSPLRRLISIPVAWIVPAISWVLIAPAASSAEPETERVKVEGLSEGSGEDWGGLPPGKGREEVYYACQACHSLAIVKQQGLSREWWDDTLTWMVEEQNMAELDAEDRALILDYLATHFGPNQ